MKTVCAKECPSNHVAYDATHSSPTRDDFVKKKVQNNKLQNNSTYLQNNFSFLDAKLKFKNSKSKLWLQSKPNTQPNKFYWTNRLKKLPDAEFKVIHLLLGPTLPKNSSKSTHNLFYQSCRQENKPTDRQKNTPEKCLVKEKWKFVAAYIYSQDMQMFHP